MLVVGWDDMLRRFSSGSSSQRIFEVNASNMLFLFKTIGLIPKLKLPFASLQALRHTWSRELIPHQA